MWVRISWVLCVCVALALRWMLVDFKSGDYVNHLSQWYRFILENGGYWSLQHEFSNYNVLYLYVLVGASYVVGDANSLYIVKAISIFFEFVSAAFVYLIVQLKYESRLQPLAASATVLLAPTVLLNGAYWGQADAIYTSGLIGCLYFLCVDRKWLACVMFALAVSAKLQAAFFAPVLGVWLLRRRLSISQLVVIPAIFVLILLPAWFAGRPAASLISIYSDQIQRNQRLTMNAPNIYQWISNDYYQQVIYGGFFAALAIVLFGSFYFARVHVRDIRPMVIALSLLVMIAVPYLLPKMHERFFYPADVLSIIFAFYFPRYWFVPLLVISSSVLSYAPYLWDWEVVPLEFLSITMLTAAIATFVALWGTLETGEQKKASFR